MQFRGEIVESSKQPYAPAYLYRAAAGGRPAYTVFGKLVWGAAAYFGSRALFGGRVD